ncbi:replicative helicase loader/inhibitor [Paenibacillus sp. HWE-109]|uniref:replicative helicase loader/inhibitor n=1 Tax=Paenibacillus sp. HWE-109 TaxID=1306526 RepID=UPI001EDE670A|nr:replicative helicase loader/inhibitor [Paenibacillus sp. HWE-109]UKS27182.1 replicative helicase loader/inhibitor [Paenibacillus sp. HWE-109]
MNRAEVIQLFKKIKGKYPSFQMPSEILTLKYMVDEWLEDLEHTPFEVATENLRRHSDSAAQWPPSIGQLKQPLKTDEDLYHESMKRSAQEYLAQKDEWIKNSVGPPDHIKAMMRLPLEERLEAIKAYAGRNERESEC